MPSHDLEGILEDILNAMGFTGGASDGKGVKTLDAFQEDALHSLQSGKNVTIHAPVGAGKSVPAMVWAIASAFQPENIELDFTVGLSNIAKPHSLAENGTSSEEYASPFMGQANTPGSVAPYYNGLRFTFEGDPRNLATRRSGAKGSSKLSNGDGDNSSHDTDDQEKPMQMPVLWLCPYKTLVKELFQQALKVLDDGRELVGISTGDAPIDRSNYSNFKLVFATYESVRFLSSSSVDKVIPPRLVILDECQVVHEAGRGAAIERMIAALLDSGTQLCALSGTLDDPTLTSSWLRSELIETTIEPVHREFLETNRLRTSKGLASLIDECKRAGPVLVFASTRVRCEKAARSYLRHVSKASKGKPTDNADAETPWAEITDDSLGDYKQLPRAAQLALGIPIELQDMFSYGVAYHHAGLNRWVRTAVEQLYREVIVDVLFCTPTLAAGVNLPTRTVVMIDPPEGMSKLLHTFHQLAGRAARRAYWKSGSVVVPRFLGLSRYFTKEPYGFETQKLNKRDSRLSQRAEMQFQMLEYSMRRGLNLTPDSVMEALASTMWWRQMGSQFKGNTPSPSAKRNAIARFSSRFINQLPDPDEQVNYSESKVPELRLQLSMMEKEAAMANEAASLLGEGLLDRLIDCGYVVVNLAQNVRVTRVGRILANALVDIQHAPQILKCSLRTTLPSVAHLFAAAAEMSKFLGRLKVRTSYAAQMASCAFAAATRHHELRQRAQGVLFGLLLANKYSDEEYQEMINAVRSAAAMIMQLRMHAGYADKQSLHSGLMQFLSKEWRFQNALLDFLVDSEETKGASQAVGTANDADRTEMQQKSSARDHRFHRQSSKTAIHKLRGVLRDVASMSVTVEPGQTPCPADDDALGSPAF